MNFCTRFFQPSDARRRAGLFRWRPNLDTTRRCACFSFLLLFLFKRERSIHGLLCVVQITLLARSTLFTVILAIRDAALRRDSSESQEDDYRGGAFFSVVGAWQRKPSFFDNTRMGDLTKLALVKPLALTKLDLSISDRVAHLVFSLKGTWDNHFLPNGFTSWGNYYHSGNRQRP